MCPNHLGTAYLIPPSWHLIRANSISQFVRNLMVLKKKRANRFDSSSGVTSSMLMDFLIAMN